MERPSTHVPWKQMKKKLAEKIKCAWMLKIKLRGREKVLIFSWPLPDPQKSFFHFPVLLAPISLKALRNIALHPSPAFTSQFVHLTQDVPWKTLVPSKQHGIKTPKANTARISKNNLGNPPPPTLVNLNKHKPHTHTQNSKGSNFC